MMMMIFGFMSSGRALNSLWFYAVRFPLFCLLSVFMGCSGVGFDSSIAGLGGWLVGWLDLGFLSTLYDFRFMSVCLFLYFHGLLWRR